jgi:hypothetical protein
MGMRPAWPWTGPSSTPTFVLWAAPLKMGFPSSLLKMALDKHLPLIHPYMLVDHGEAHHRKRYAHYPRIGLLLEKEARH